MFILLLGALALALGFFQSGTIRMQLEERGKSIGQSLAATSIHDLLNYDYISLEQVANQAARDPDILYVVVHDKEARVAGYSNKPQLQGRVLSDEVSLRAAAATAPVIQKVVGEEDKLPGLDIAIPVVLPESGDRWGTVRVCLSLEPMYRQISQTVWIIAAVGLAALGLGILVAAWGARRVTRPLGDLVGATMEAARGNLKQKIVVNTRDEVEVLAFNFSLMMGKILAHQEQQTAQLAEIQRLQDYTQKLLSTMADGLLTVVTDGTVATINPAARDLLGISRAHAVKGSSLASLVGHDCPLQQFVLEILKNPSAIRRQEMQIDREGDARTVLVSASVLNDEDGRPLEAILNLHDITERKHLEARIRQSERLAALGTLAAGMAHEIRNPLSAIKTFVQLLPRKIDKPGFLEKFNRTVPRETNRINLLVEELLELSREPRYNYEATDIKVLLEQSLDMLREELLQRKIQCRREIQDGLPLVQADANQLVKAFHNLSSNAVQAMPAGGCLTIRAFIDEKADVSGEGRAAAGHQWMAIVFEDTGEGISREGLAQIFNPFFTTKDTGTGLGLPITHKVITEHGGHIDAESIPGRGSQFYIRLPLGP